MPTFTPTQQRIMDVMSDGLPHTSRELIKRCLNDEDQPVEHMKVMIFNLRKRLPESQVIIGETRGQGQPFTYRLARVLKTDD